MPRTANKIKTYFKLLNCAKMSATAFKNAVRRREHYERHQPKAREHLGLLEKHKDYTQRAKAFHDKEKRITKLKQKAANRNPDEFYFKMLNTRTKVGLLTSWQSFSHSCDHTCLRADVLRVRILKSVAGRRASGRK